MCSTTVLEDERRMTQNVRTATGGKRKFLDSPNHVLCINTKAFLLRVAHAKALDRSNKTNFLPRAKKKDSNNPECCKLENFVSHFSFTKPRARIFARRRRSKMKFQLLHNEAVGFDESLLVEQCDDDDAVKDEDLLGRGKHFGVLSFSPDL